MLRTAFSLTLAQGKQDFARVNRTGYQIDEVWH